MGVSTVNKKLLANSGQSFVEFILLLLVMVVISFSMLVLINRGIGERWKTLITVITRTNDSPPVDFR